MCDECKEKTKDRKALKLHRAPEVLLIMLKRTMYPSTEKDDRHITFPLEARPPALLYLLVNTWMHRGRYPLCIDRRRPGSWRFGMCYLNGTVTAMGSPQSCFGFACCSWHAFILGMYHHCLWLSWMALSAGAGPCPLPL